MSACGTRGFAIVPSLDNIPNGASVFADCSPGYDPPPVSDLSSAHSLSALQHVQPALQNAERPARLLRLKYATPLPLSTKET